MSIQYHCPHLDEPHRAPLPSSYPSSSTSFTPLESLYFCEECDAVRCNQCVGVEVASYYCPNCLFDVPSANVRADRNRCNRSCFACPQCSTAMQIQATETPDQNTGQMIPGPPYTLSCTGCKWNSKLVGWEFDKATGIALQMQKSEIGAAPKADFDAIKDHLESYMSLSNPEPPRQTSRVPTRHISHLTQMAARALHRDIPSNPSKSRKKPRGLGAEGMEKGHVKWDELKDYEAKEAWRGHVDGSMGVDEMRDLRATDIAGLEKRWCQSWDRSFLASNIVPERIQLHTKLTKRCPHPSCRHLLIQLDTKSVRFKIKMVALNYLPTVEIGRRRRRPQNLDGASPSEIPPEELERRRRERRRTRPRTGLATLPGEEEEEDMTKHLGSGQVYTFQMAFTNPLYDPIQIRLTQPHLPRDAPPVNHHIHIPTQHFTVSALKDAWAYDDDEEEEDDVLAGGAGGGMEGSSEVPSDEGLTALGSGTLGRRTRTSILGTGSGGLREKRTRGEVGVEKKGNMTKVLLEVEVLPTAKQGEDVVFDLEVRYTYRAEGADSSAGPQGKTGEGGEDGKKDKGGDAGVKDELKTFTFWIRVNVGTVQ